jgi:signal recognition particle receptor subunit beta
MTEQEKNEQAACDAFEARYEAWESWCTEYDVTDAPCAEEVSAALAFAISRGRRELPSFLSHISDLSGAFDALESALNR